MVRTVPLQALQAEQQIHQGRLSVGEDRDWKNGLFVFFSRVGQ